MVTNPFGSSSFEEQDDTDMWPYDLAFPSVPIKNYDNTTSGGSILAQPHGTEVNNNQLNWQTHTPVCMTNIIVPTGRNWLAGTILINRHGEAY